MNYTITYTTGGITNTVNASNYQEAFDTWQKLFIPFDTTNIEVFFTREKPYSIFNIYREANKYLVKVYCVHHKRINAVMLKLINLLVRNNYVRDPGLIFYQECYYCSKYSSYRRYYNQPLIMKVKNSKLAALLREPLYDFS